jgi:hypothetical protein
MDSLSYIYIYIYIYMLALVIGDSEHNIIKLSFQRYSTLFSVIFFTTYVLFMFIYISFNDVVRSCSIDLLSKMNNEFKKELEESGRGLVEVLSRILTGGTKKDHESPQSE